MMGHRVLIFLALIAAPPLAYARYASWREGVFPNDLSWLSPLHKKEHPTDIKNEIGTKKDNVCWTAECKRIADEFLSSIDKSVDPCDDFYKYTCGGWSTNNPIPPNSPSWSRFMIFQKAVEHRIRGVLEADPDPSDILPVKQAKKWYHSCMDTETTEARGVKPIESILQQIGGWPIAMDELEWDEEQYTWQRVDQHYMRLTGSNAFFDIDPDSPTGNATAGDLMISAADLPLYRQLPLKYRNYTGNDYDMYVRLVEKAANLFVHHNRADICKERVRKEAEDLVEFEKQIYELKTEDYGYEEMNIIDFFEWYKSNVSEANSDPRAEIDWHAIIQGLFDIANIKVDPSSDVYLVSFDYIKGIGELLKNTPSRTIVNYIHWTFVGNMLPYTTEAVRNEYFELVNEEYGVKERPPRWNECVDEMKMTHAAAYGFVNKFFTKYTETAALKMVKNIRIQMEEEIEKSNWLDAESKAVAKDKLNSMKMFIGFPDWYKNKTAISTFYKGLTIGSEYFDNTLSSMRYEKKHALKQYKTPITEEDPWFIDPITVNAVYGGYENALNVPAVDFQAPLFTPGLPDNVNYGIVGVIVGHEIGHGFDDSGIQLGKNGSETTLSSAMIKNYYQRADCFLDQFEKYYGETKPPEVEGTTTEQYMWGRRYGNRGMITRGENIADTTGIQAVFEAYKNQNRKKEGGDAKLPGLEYLTDDQLFFVSFAAMWCEINTPEFEEKQKKSFDVHSPPTLRVIGAVSNTEDFAKAFNCPAGSPMNPSNKCSIWQKPSVPPKVEKLHRKKKHHPWIAHWSE